ncbi:MAG: cytochrome c3 family protein [Nitrospirae bacterium]|nr:cytochrome c3 family protein [Nitrospirota bacterium]
MGIINSKHNLSITGPGELKALTETGICIFCHTPHNATPQTPLWNKSIEPVNYILYTSTTQSVVPSPPSGPSRLCLSCHDGTLALGAVLQPSSGIATTGQITVGKPSYIGVILSDDHPFSFSYLDALPNPYAGLNPVLLPSDLPFYGGSSMFIECSTCHDAHEDSYRTPDKNGQLTGKFLVMDNRASALCIRCHSNIDGWALTTHRTSTSSTGSVLPLSPRSWPTWSIVSDWACEGCHTSHSAGGPERLLNNLNEEDNCYTCHNGVVAEKNIFLNFQKPSRHPVESFTGDHDPTELPTFITKRHVECADCHNPHASNSRIASAPYVSGRLEKVTGMTIERAAVNPANYEYEICFKCHAELFQRTPFIPRVLDNTNTQETFSLVNPSYHPVVGTGKNPNVPSIPSSFEPALTASSIIYCTDCHSDDSGSKGPHGSSFAPILREQYETTDNTPESYQDYALCYRCHDRTSILNDESFRKHKKHIVDESTPCSVCHDPHGIADNGFSGSHTHLINFDIRIVAPKSGNPFPVFTDNGTFSGSCTLVCHGKVHDNESYP